MNNIKSIRDSLLSALCIISWTVIVFRIFNTVIDEGSIIKLVGTWMITISTGVVGGVALHFYCMLRKRSIRHSFVYNLFATLNIIAGSIGMTLPLIPGLPTPYLIAASFAVGIVMYKNIYHKIKWIAPR